MPPPVGLRHVRQCRRQRGEDPAAAAERDADRPSSVDGVDRAADHQAAAEGEAAAPEHLADAYGIARRNYYYALADRRPASRKYARRRDGGKGGWICRAEEFISPRYHLTDAEHRKRTASWR